MKIEIIGVYPVDEAQEPCHLIELQITEHSGPIDVGAFTQEWPGKPKSSWQVAWDERVLNPEGTEDQLGKFPRNIVADGSLRLTFYLHYLSVDRPLITPAGEIPIPTPSKRPARLNFLKYMVPG